MSQRDLRKNVEQLLQGHCQSKAEKKKSTECRGAVAKTETLEVHGALSLSFC